MRISTSNASGGSGGPSANVGSAQATGTIAAGASKSQSLTVTVPTTPGTYYVWVVADNNGALTQTNYTNDFAVSSSFTVTAATTVDVQPINVTRASSSVTAGGSLDVSWQIRNNGTGTAASSNSQVRISTSNASGGSGGPSANVGSAQATGTISAGASKSQSLTVTVPTTPGTYYVWVVADNNGALTQTNYTNDFAVSSSFTVSAATTVDVQPINVTRASSSVTAGGSLDVSWQIRNNGTGTAASSNSQVRISTSNASGGSGGPSANVGSAQATGTISAGASKSQSLTVTAPTTPGTYYVWVVADNNGALTQTNYTNDFAVSSSFTVTAVAQLPNLVPQSITLNKSTVAAGGTVTVNWNLANTGNGNSPATVTGVRMSQSSSSGNTQPYTSFSTVAMPAVNANSSTLQTTTVTVPAGTTAGTYYVWIIADNVASGAITQSDYTDDYQRSVAFTVTAVVQLPNLVPQSITLNKSTVAAGGTVTVNWNLANTGNGNSPATVTGVRMNQSSSSGNTQPYTSFSTVAMPAVNANSSTPQTTTVTVPSGTAAGTYYIWIIADNVASGAITQSDYTDDYQRSVAFTVTAVTQLPNLVPQSITLNKSTVAAGGTVTVNWNLANTGNGNSPATVTGVRMNQSSSSGNAQPYTSFPNATMPAVSANSTTPQTTTITVPSGMAAGTYYIWIIADNVATGAISQSNYTDDYQRSVAFAVTTPNISTSVADGFDYPLGNRGFYTPAVDGDAWFDAQPFLTFNADYNKYHLGEDWNLNTGEDFGQSVYAVATGTIVYANIASGWGRVVVVRHKLADGTLYESMYGHLASFNKTSGTVARGEKIGTVGDGSEGGTTYSSHLHFEIRNSTCPQWGNPGPGYWTNTSPQGWLSPANFIANNRPGTQGADLVVEAVQFSPASVMPGDQFNLTYRIRNIGSGPTQPTIARMRLSADNKLTALDPGLTPLDEAIPSLASSAFKEVSRTVQVPAGIASGNYYVGVFADAGFAVNQPTHNDAGLSSEKIVIGVPVAQVTIDFMDPPIIAGSSGPTTLTIRGTGFQQGCFVRLYDNTNSPHGPFDLVPIDPSATQLVISAKLTTAAATWTAQVINPTGPPSNEISFTVQGTTATMAIQEITPNPVMTSDGLESFRVKGTGFQPGCTILLRNKSKALAPMVNVPTSTGATELWITADLGKETAQWSAQVVNPGEPPSAEYGFETLAPTLSDPNTPTPGVNPTPLEMSDYLDQLSAEFKVPAVILKALVYQESRWRQFQDDGTPVLRVEPGNRLGIGLTQITVKLDNPTDTLGSIQHGTPEGENPFSITRSMVTFDIERLKWDWRHNLKIGTRLLLAKRAACKDNLLDARILENWYYTLAYFNGAGADTTYNNDPSKTDYSRVARPGFPEDYLDRYRFPYQECVFHAIAHRGVVRSDIAAKFGQPLEVTVGGPSSVGSGSGPLRFLSNAFRFWDYAIFRENGTAEMCHSSGTTGGGHAEQKTYTGVAVNVVGFGSGTTGSVANLNGRVEDASGAGVSGVRLAVASAGDLASYSTTITDESGNYSFQELPTHLAYNLGFIDTSAPYAGQGGTIIPSSSGTSVTLSSTAPTIPPSITSEPESQKVAEGATMRFSVAAQGSAPLQFQWFVDGVAVSGAVSREIDIQASASWDSDSAITVRVSNSAGSVESSIAKMEVYSMPTLKLVRDHGRDTMALQWPKGWPQMYVESSENLQEWAEVELRYNPADGFLEVPIVNGGRQFFRLSGMLIAGSTQAPQLGPVATVTGGIGQAIQLEVPVVGAMPSQFEWYRGNQLIEQTTVPQLQIASLSPTTAGTYRVVARNAYGSTISGSFVVQAAGWTYDSWLTEMVDGEVTSTTTGYGRNSSLLGDGVSNLLKYAFGLTPSQSMQYTQPLARIVSSGGASRPRIDFERLLTPSDVTTRIEASGNLVSWRDVTTEMIPVNSPIPSWDGLSEHVTLQCPVSLAQVESQNWKYLRVAVTDLNLSPPTVLLSDDFNDGSIDTAIWTAAGNTVQEQDGYLKLLTNQTDAGGKVLSKEFPMPADGLTLTRKARVHYSNSYSIPSIKLGFFDESNQETWVFSVSYGNMSYDAGVQHSVFGTFLGLGQGNPHDDNLRHLTVEGPAVLWDQWFDEKITYDRQTGLVRYFRNGIQEISGTAPIKDTGAPVFLKMDGWGWNTGHWHHCDDLLIRSGVDP